MYVMFMFHFKNLPGGGCGVEGVNGQKRNICNIFDNKDKFLKI